MKVVALISEVYNFVGEEFCFIQVIHMTNNHVKIHLAWVIYEKPLIAMSNQA